MELACLSGAGMSDIQPPERWISLGIQIYIAAYYARLSDEISRPYRSLMKKFKLSD